MNKSMLKAYLVSQGKTGLSKLRKSALLSLAKGCLASTVGAASNSSKGDK
jgi:hypothetical protein